MSDTPTLELVSSWKQYGGWNRRYKYVSPTLGNTTTTFTVYFPPAADKGPVPVFYWLSGLTCTDDNFTTKAGAQRRAAQLGLALVMPDTSPRGAGVEGEAEGWDFGVGAGFYLNATQPKWATHWRMYDFVVKELPAVLKTQLGEQLDTGRAAISGHSMGGHGAITIALKNPGLYKAVSAFAPICNPVNVPWGVKAFSGYLGEDRASWAQYDATELMKGYAGPHLPLLIDQGSSDNFLAAQLAPQALQEAAAARGYAPFTLRMQEGYDHSYFFISTFIDDHLDHAARALGLAAP